MGRARRRHRNFSRAPPLHPRRPSRPRRPGPHRWRRRPHLHRKGPHQPRRPRISKSSALLLRHLPSTARSRQILASRQRNPSPRPHLHEGSRVKILIRATNWIGDAIMSIPALQAIRCREPQAEISILARRAVAGIYENQPFANEILPLEDAPDPAAGLRELRFDVAILLQNAFSAAWLVWRAKIPERIGYARDGRSPLLTRAIPVPKNGEIPAHEYFLK